MIYSLFHARLHLKMAARYLTAEEALQRVLDEDGDYSDKSEAELWEDDSNGGSEHKENQESESDEFLSDEVSSQKSVKFFLLMSSFRVHLCSPRVFPSFW